jgi:hypothetical protein
MLLQQSLAAGRVCCCRTGDDSLILRALLLFPHWMYPFSADRDASILVRRASVCVHLPPVQDALAVVCTQFVCLGHSVYAQDPGSGKPSDVPAQLPYCEGVEVSVCAVSHLAQLTSTRSANFYAEERH